MWDPYDRMWEEGFRHYVSFPADARGKRNAPRAYVTDGGYRLGVWQNTQRQAYRRGGLDEVRKRKETRTLNPPPPLNALPPPPSAPSPSPLHLLTPPAPPPRPKVRIARLEAAGMVWEPQLSAWEQGFAALASYPADSRGRRHVPHGDETPSPIDHPTHWLPL